MQGETARSGTGTATILFTDLVDSTAQRAVLGEETAERVRQAHDRLLVEAVTPQNGTVVKNTGDGFMVTFASAADAVAAAVAIQQAVHQHNRRAAGARLAVRVGISLGDVTWEGSDCFGIPVIEAARLCAAAEGGQILAADLVRLTARGRGGHAFSPIGPVAAKGLPEPIATCAVVWEPLAEASVPLPPRIGTRPAFAMFGRGDEAEALAVAWAKAQDGKRQVVLLSGEPGIGKTRLATETARAAHADGGTVLFGSCDEDVGLPYRPFVEALRYYVAHAPEEVLAVHVASHRGELARLVPELARRVADVPAPQVAEAETERFLLFEAVTGLLATASQESPIVLILDDLHWAGTPELLLLKHVIRSAEPMRLLVIGTYRDTDLLRTHPLTAVLADLRREAAVERVSLHGLDDAAVETLVEAVARHELDEPLLELAHAMRRETEGNPFFIGEVIRHLGETGVFFQEGERWKIRGTIETLGIPEGVREVIGRRLGRLSEATNRILSLGAVIGRQFDVPLLAKVAETSEDAVLDALDEATAAALVSEARGGSGQFAFRHALIRTTLYEELSATRRARLHRRVGEALEELVQAPAKAGAGTRIEELAHHWLAATEAADAAKAIDYARQAGERALAGLAFEEAAGHFERALAVLTPSDRAGQTLRCDLLIGLGEAQKRAGNAGYRETVKQAIEMARAVDDGERLPRAVLATARPGGFMTSARAVDHELIALYEEAAAVLGEADSLLRARLLGQLAVELVYTADRDRRDALSHEAVAIARRLGDRGGLAQVLILRLLAMNDPFTLAERLALSAELAGLAEEVDSNELAWHAATLRSSALLEAGEITDVERTLCEAERLGDELRQPFYAWWNGIARTMLAVMRGDADAETRALSTFELGTAAGQPDAAEVFAAELANIRHNDGRVAEFVDALRTFAEANPHVPAPRAGLARSYCDLDRHAEAREQIDLFRSDRFRVPLNWAWIGYMASLSPAVCDVRDADAAAVLYAELLPVAGQVDVFGLWTACGGSIAHSCGMLAVCLGRFDDAERHFADALAMNERLGARPYAVRTRRAWAEMLLDRNTPGDAARAGELIAAGRAEAETLGMARELVRFERLLARVENP